MDTTDLFGYIRVCKDNKWAYFDKYGKQITDFIFDRKKDKMDIFCEGYAAVGLNGKVGYINTFGTIVIPCIYDFGENFIGGVAPVKQNGKWHYINYNGDIVMGDLTKTYKTEIRGINIWLCYWGYKKNKQTFVFTHDGVISETEFIARAEKGIYENSEDI